MTSPSLREQLAENEKIAAAAVAEHRLDVYLSRSTMRYGAQCSCGWDTASALRTTALASFDGADGAGVAHVTDAILAALRDAGRLLPDGGQSREIEGWTHPKDGVVPYWSYAEGMSSTPTHRRTVTEWSDGSVLTGPWRPVDGEVA